MTSHLRGRFDATDRGDHTVIRPPRLTRALTVGEDDQVARAERALAGLGQQFDFWIVDEAKLLEGHARSFLSAPIDPETLKAFRLATLGFRGNALQFGFPVAARIAESLVEILDNPSCPTFPPAIVDRYVNGIHSIVRSGTEKGNGPTAVAIADALERLVQELAPLDVGGPGSP